jgi:hypothetical protein
MRVQRRFMLCPAAASAMLLLGDCAIAQEPYPRSTTQKASRSPSTETRTILLATSPFDGGFGHEFRTGQPEATAIAGSVALWPPTARIGLIARVCRTRQGS